VLAVILGRGVRSDRSIASMTFEDTPAARSFCKSGVESE